MSDIPILEGEETWSQEAIDNYRKNGYYKVVYYPHNSGGSYNHLKFKDFNNLKEATDFANTRGSGNVLEIKWYTNES